MGRKQVLVGAGLVVWCWGGKVVDYDWVRGGWLGHFEGCFEICLCFECFLSSRGWICYVLWYWFYGYGGR